MARPKNSQPAYLLHQRTGQARVRLNGKDIYLGKHDTPESKQLYHQLLADYAAGRPVTKKPTPGGQKITINELVNAYRKAKAEEYGKEQMSIIASSIRPLVETHGSTFVSDFSPLKLEQAVERLLFVGDSRPRKKLDENGDKVADTTFRPLSRYSANVYLRQMKKIFKWGVSKELVPGAIYQALLTVEAIKKNSRMAKQVYNKKKVKPVPLADIQAALVECRQEIRAMINLQLLSAMRPDEVTILRPCDIDRTGKVWVYRPEAHKNDWRENEDETEDRKVKLGPQAQAILAPWLEKCADDEYVFSPQKVSRRWKEEAGASGRVKTFLMLQEKAPPREHYDDSSYRQAIKRACKRAGVEVWTPNRLRHNMATSVRAQFGVEASTLVCGHKNVKTNEIYAEKANENYEKIILQVG